MDKSFRTTALREVHLPGLAKAESDAHMAEILNYASDGENIPSTFDQSKPSDFGIKTMKLGRDEFENLSTESSRRNSIREERPSEIERAVSL